MREPAGGDARATESGAFFVEIITAEGESLCWRATLVELPTAEGQIGIMAGHQPLLILLGTGYLHVHRFGGCTTYFAAGGFAKIKPDRVVLIID